MLQWQLDSWLHGYCGVTTVTNAELQAIYNGLSIAWLEGIRNIICKFDSMCMCLEAHSGAKIKGLIQMDWHVCFQHTLREGNQVVDWLANKGSRQDSQLLVLETFP
ncbi:hypothetical protein JHK85_045163 [Glycine max]|nr:hypothetical protein JHK85_045163 [Glycine max]